MEPKLFSEQIKAPNTLSVHFDKRGDRENLNQDCIDKYQENAYLLGKLFSVDTNNGGGVVEEGKDAHGWELCEWLREHPALTGKLHHLRARADKQCEDVLEEADAHHLSPSLLRSGTHWLMHRRSP